MTPWLASLIGAVAIALVVAEVKGGLHAVARRIAARAARTLPDAHVERWTEEWASDLEGYGDRPLSALLRALEFRRDAREMRRNLLGMPSHARSSVAMKRALDLVVASAALFFAAPSLGLLMVAIKLDSLGPSMFRGARVGQGGTTFHVVKLRTMAVGVAPPRSDHPLRAVWTLWDDPHLTRVGGFLRRTHLDHLPMLINVLRGDMSLVGPPPGLPAESRDEPGAFTAPTVKPGLTGLSQLADLETPPSDRRLMDEDYAESWSVRGDLRILARTVWRMFTG